MSTLNPCIHATTRCIRAMANGVAVYTSERDKALDLSSLLFRNPRLGLSSEEMDGWETQVLANLEDIQFIDVSEAEKHSREFLGHNYFHRNPCVSADIAMFVYGYTPGDRHLIKPQSSDLHWRFPENYDQLIAR